MAPLKSRQYNEDQALIQIAPIEKLRNLGRNGLPRRSLLSKEKDSGFDVPKEEADS
jgi:hypothetical protein